MKTSVLIASLFTVAASAVMAETPTQVKVYDHNKTIYKDMKVTDVYCRPVEVPIYRDVQTQGDAAGGALAGMIIGGILGKGVSGNDDGAAAGAVIGGLIGADKGSKPKTERQIVGYEYVEQCDEINKVERVAQEVYSHSTIRFYLNGKRYVVKFVR